MKKVFLGLFVLTATVHAVEPEKIQRARVPAPPWAQGDERGMANQIGPATYQRCAWHMAQPDARVYELSQLRSDDHAAFPFRRAVHAQAEGDLADPGYCTRFQQRDFQ